MKHITFTSNTSFTIALLIKDSYLIASEIEKSYKRIIEPFKDTLICFGLEYSSNNKITASQAKKYLNKLLPALVQLGITTLYVCDSTYFKILTKQTKADKHIGYILPCKVKGYEHINIIYGINYGQLLYNPNLYTKLDLSLDTFINFINGTYKQLGKDIIHYEYYPTKDISTQLDKLLSKSILTIDIETYALDLKNASLATIAFAWNKHEGIAFNVDKPTRLLLKQFFEKYTGIKIFHNASFDIRNIIFTCFMKNDTDYQGLLHGLHTMYKNTHDTKIIAYLALNSTTRVDLSLKDLSHEYTGNYALEVNDISKLNNQDLLRYNLIDCLATWFVYQKYYPILIKDNQLKIYQELFLPTQKVITQIELIGMPIDLNQVNKVKQELLNQKKTYTDIINQNSYVLIAQEQLQLIELDRLNKQLKTKQHTLDKVKNYLFNPSSNYHLRHLLYAVLKLPILDYTESKEASTSTSTLEKLLNHNKEHNELLNAFIGLSKVEKLLTAFLPAFENAYIKSDNHAYLHGNFNVTGTVSARLSSSNVNLQQLPSSGTFGKLIKSCFKPKNKWLMVGADFNALEDKVNTLLTRDPNKEKVWIDGYDGHCYRAYYYWKDKMPDIEDTVKSINSIKHKYPQLRQASKAPSFALNYKGTYKTLMNNCGFSEEEAKNIEKGYHEMYQVSDKWLQDKLDLCSKQGYIDVAFGLRIRTPLLAKSVLGSSKTLHEAQNEARSVGNALSGQSYCLLNNRAITDFMSRVWGSDYRHDILPIALIHDAMYFICKDDIRIIHWLNKQLIECMQWQELVELKHDKIKLGGELGIFYPNWSNEITIPNQATKEEILKICKQNI